MKAHVLLLMPLLLGAGTARAQDGLIGVWRADEGPDVAAQLVLRADGTFDYALAAGALDEAAQGRWVQEGAQMCLTTAPKPVPPQFIRQPAPAEGPTVRVVWPDGRGIAGVDLRVGFDSGDPVESYTQEDGWSLPADETRIPRWIDLVEPIHGLIAPRYALGPDDHGRLLVMLEPHDLGTVDFDHACLEARPGGAVLHRREGDFRWRKARD